MLATRVAEGIISEEQAQSYSWLDEPCKSNNYLERHNKHQKYLLARAGGERFVALKGEILPKFLAGADLAFADLAFADLEDADLEDADLRGANLAGAVIDAVSILEETDKLHGVDFTNTQFSNLGDLQEIIERMVELKITDVKGLGDDYQAALVEAGLIVDHTNPAPNTLEI